MATDIFENPTDWCDTLGHVLVVQARHVNPCFSLCWYVYVCGRGCCARELASPPLIMIGLRDAFEGPVLV
jgi:hypothetical protein